MMKLIDDIKNIDVSIVKIMNYGFRFSFVFCLVATYILFLYIVNPVSHIVFEIGCLAFKCSITFFVAFFIGAFTTDKIKKKVL